MDKKTAKLAAKRTHKPNSIEDMGSSTRIVKRFIRSRPKLNDLVMFAFRIWSSFRLPNIFGIARGYIGFLRDFLTYRRLAGAETLRIVDLYPCVLDKTTSTPLDLNYFLQDTWAAEKVFKSNPSFHVDVGSTALLVGILSKFTNVCSVDIRPLPIEMAGLESRTGTILALPFPDKSLRSVSSLCVIEHIGLGRYGDPLDPSGTDRAAKELERVLAVDGNLYVSVPIDPIGRVCFNAHRSFDFESFVRKFKQLEVADALLIQKGRVFRAEERDDIPYINGMVIGLFHFKRT